MKDDSFLRGHQVPMTKEPVRALALARLALQQARCLIDVGAGTGSVSLEAALNWPQLQVIAIEHNPSALALLADNCQHFGCQNVQIVSGRAPLPISQQADALFIGGSGGQLTALIDWALAQLLPGGRLVMTFILQENLMSALDHLASCAVCELDCLQLQASTLTALGQGHYFKPNNPTFLISCQKANSND
jgi:cobalt-precorrin-6B (C15)-methyltransferase